MSGGYVEKPCQLLDDAEASQIERHIACTFSGVGGRIGLSDRRGGLV